MRYRLKFALAVGFSVLVTLGPLVMIDVVIGWIALEQGRSNLKSMSNTMLAHAENLLDGAVGSLEILAAEDIDSCSRVGIRRIGEVVFTRASVKEIGVVDDKGRMLCSNYGPSLVNTGAAGGAGSPDGTIELAMIPTRLQSRRALGVKRQGKNGGLVAFLQPGEVLLDLLHGQSRENCHARLMLADGTVIRISGESAEQIRVADPEFLEVTANSSRYPISVVLAGTRTAFTKPFAQIQGYAKIGSGILSIAFLMMVGFASRNRSSLESEIEEAVHNDEFIAHYQPIVDVKTGRISGCEALIRWQKPNGDLIRPDLFVPIAEASGQILPMTRQLMERVCVDLKPLFQVTPDFYVSINIVAEHFKGHEIVDDVRRIFSEGSIATSNLVFEITERRPLEDIGAARQVVGALQGLGARVALDDAGTGHGGLAYIQQLGMDIIKIDRMFVEAIGTAAVSAPVVDALLELGTQLNMTIIAEGVETEEQFEYLRRCGARYIQGYLFSPPLPPKALARFVASFNGAGAGAQINDAKDNRQAKAMVSA